MKKKKIIALAVGVAMILVLLMVFWHHVGEKRGFLGHIIDRGYQAKLQDSELDYRRENFRNEKVKEDFSSDIVNEHTVNFFLFLDDICKSSVDLADNLEKARQYLYSVLPPETADKMLKLYEIYLNYQIGLQDKMKELGMTTDLLDNLSKLQDYRRAVFGKENADIIFGASVEAQEYAIRRNAIVYEDNLYAAQKEQLLKELNSDMWGDELTADADVPAYTRYQKKLQFYKRDMAELRTEEEKQTFLQHLRMEVFDPVQRQRLEQVDRAIAEEKMIKEQYLAKEREILNDPNLSEKEREKRIRELQDATFGEEADAFRRGQAIEKGAQQFKK
ncbi:MAG: lipase chaperone [Deltaproteobacteria bacterium]|nr:lipase chaperone [Deltaproteobacteria bacterium]